MDRSIEIDHISVNDDERWILLGNCKRSSEKLIADAPNFDKHVSGFLATKEGKEFQRFRLRKAAFAPTIDSRKKEELRHLGFEPFGFDELLAKLP